MDRRNRRNYYRLLHVQPDAPFDVIKASYRTLMRTLKHHPDLGGDQWNATLINEAYAVLSNPESRESYDRERENLGQGLGPTARATRAPELALESSKAEVTESIHPASLSLAESRICAFCRTKNNGRYHVAGEDCSGCGAPLRLVDPPAGTSRTRETERIEYQTDIHYRTEGVRPDATAGRVVDLSPTGLRFVSSERLTSGCVIKIDSPTLSAVAMVTRSVPDHMTGFFSTGVRFLTLRLGRPRGTFISECA